MRKSLLSWSCHQNPSRGQSFVSQKLVKVVSDNGLGSGAGFAAGFYAGFAGKGPF
jgi:hypothetical protein